VAAKGFRMSMREHTNNKKHEQLNMYPIVPPAGRNVACCPSFSPGLVSILQPTRFTYAAMHIIVRHYLLGFKPQQ